MAFDWRRLREPAPERLEGARKQAHWAAQALTKAARANLAAKADDSHTALLWGPKTRALVTQALPKGARVGLDVAKLELIFWVGDEEERGTASEQWLDAKLAAAGLKPASSVMLPYEIPRAPLSGDPNLRALESWFAASAEALAEVRAKYATLKPGPSYLWPHHFDMATLLAVAPEKSIGVGVSMGDHYYPQPYAYISPYPAPKDAKPPKLPPGGRWHTHEFFGAVATADELLAQKDPRTALMAVIEAAIGTSKEWLHG